MSAGYRIVCVCVGGGRRPRIFFSVSKKVQKSDFPAKFAQNQSRVSGLYVIYCIHIEKIFVFVQLDLNYRKNPFIIMTYLLYRSISHIFTRLQ